MIGGVQVKNRSCCLHEKRSELLLGGVLKSGINYDITCRLFLDLFVDYAYQPSRFPSRVELGGLKTGVGLGFKF